MNTRKRSRENNNEEGDENLPQSLPKRQKRQPRKKIHREIQASPMPTDFSQKPILRAINLYLYFSEVKKLLRRHKVFIFPTNPRQISEGGYCHGLGLAWAGCMSVYKEKEGHYAMKRKILASCVEVNTEISLEENIELVAQRLINDLHHRLSYFKWMDDVDIEIEKFLAQIEWPQNSERHTSNLGLKIIGQQNVGDILELKNQRNLSGYYDLLQLADCLSLYQKTGDAITITGGSIFVKVKTAGGEKEEERRHTVVVFRRDDKYYLYNANVEDGEAIVFDEVKALCEAIRKSLDINPDKPLSSVTHLSMQHIVFPMQPSPDEMIGVMTELPLSPLLLPSLPPSPSSSPSSSNYSWKLTCFGSKLWFWRQPKPPEDYDEEMGLLPSPKKTQ